MKASRAKRPRLIDGCIFCNRGDLSKEHVWPEWAHEYLPKSKASHHFALRMTGSGRVKQIDSNRKRQGDLTTIQLKVVCKRHCNNGWMSRLETRAKLGLIALFTGKTAALDKYTQEIIATWIAMKLMVCEWSVPHDVFSSAAERSLLMGRRRPPDTLTLWIGNYIGQSWPNAYARFTAGVAVGFRSPGPLSPSGKNVQSQTLLAGKLFVQAMTTTNPWLQFQTPKYAATALRQIWPYQRDILWPPLFGLSDIVASQIATEFDRMTGNLPTFPGGPNHR